jgi:deoxyribodipyrimidine photo-lyase
MITKIDYHFPTDYKSILERIENINPLKYARTRNYLDGEVTYLSPYISRGVISVKTVLDIVLKNDFKLYQIEKFVQELCWREYWQHIWQAKGDDILKDLKHEQPSVLHHKIPTAIIEHNTSIDALDLYIEQLYEQGYMHNHVRMYVASLACNVAKSHWLQPARWLYYHLLDGDVGSNHISWQWVAGSASSKKYYCNQDNINKYTGSKQQNTFLDKSYEEIISMPVPDKMQATSAFTLTTELPAHKKINLDSDKDICIYNSYNLDPSWRKDDDVNKILLLEPSHFEKYPVSEKVIDFILALAKNIDGIQIYVAEFSSLQKLIDTKKQTIYFKEHPAFTHYEGECDDRDWIAPEVTGNFNSFFSFWKKVEKIIK